MSDHTGTLTPPPLPPRLPWYLSPSWQLIMLAALIIIAEIISMGLIFYIDLPSYLATTLLDAFFMILLISPGLYLLQMRPILRYLQERDRAFAAQRESEKLLRSVLEQLPVGVWILDRQGQFLHGNPASLEIWGSPRYQANHHPPVEGWWAESGERITPQEWASVRAVRRGETSLNEEIVIRAFDGQTKTILNSALPIWNEASGLQGAIVINQDITTRREKEKALQQTHELLERVFFSIDTLIAYLDRDFNFVRVNDSFARTAGAAPEQLAGQNLFALYPHPPNEAIFRQVVSSGAPFSVFEQAFSIGPTAEVSYWDWGLQPVTTSSGEVEGVVLSLVDVTERKNAERQLERQNEELRELSAAEHRQRERAENLARATIALNADLELDQVLTSILEQIGRTIPCQGATILLSDGERLRVASSLGYREYPVEALAAGKQYRLPDYPRLQELYSTHEPLHLDPLASGGPERGQPAGIPAPAWVRSYLAVPLIDRGEVIGLINLNDHQPLAFGPEDTDHLLAFAAPAALAIHNARLFQAESTARQVAETLSAAAQALTRSLELEAVVQTLLDHIRQLVAFDTAGVTLLEDQTHLAVRAQRGYGDWAGRDPLPSFPLDGITDSVIRRMIEARQSIALPRLAPAGASEPPPGEAFDFNWLLVPIIASDKVIGLVELGRTGERHFNPEQVRWAEALVGQAAVAIQNAWLFQQVVSSSERLQSLARKLVEIQENERFHIARELHDEAGQVLSSLKISLGLLEQDPDCPPQVRQRLEALKSSADRVLEDLHRLAVDLRPIALDHLGLVAALEQYAKNLNADRLAVQLKVRGFENTRLAKDVETCLYRIVQEALTNVVRHAQAESVGILLERSAGRVKLFVEDDGVGFEPDQTSSQDRLGLVGMRERAEMFGGTLTIESYPGSGTSVIVDMPDDYSYLNN